MFENALHNRQHFGCAQKMDEIGRVEAPKPRVVEAIAITTVDAIPLLSVDTDSSPQNETQTPRQNLAASSNSRLAPASPWTVKRYHFSRLVEKKVVLRYPPEW
jgi:hypothetical protein